MILGKILLEVIHLFFDHIRIFLKFYSEKSSNIYLFFIRYNVIFKHITFFKDVFKAKI